LIFFIAGLLSVAKVLGEGGYEVVTEAGDGVLEITPHLSPLYQSSGYYDCWPLENLHHGRRLYDPGAAGQ
jgi:hypothetical protein